ncbi:MAG: hypothetical protein COA78_23790 [Blastopirellula sp.]|nr:MAG: hypothetical protein COA78_23790 [Blastopirellula sp.]
MAALAVSSAAVAVLTLFAATSVNAAQPGSASRLQSYTYRPSTTSADRLRVSSSTQKSTNPATAKSRLSWRSTTKIKVAEVQLVRPASHETPVSNQLAQQGSDDPFNDPFGDQLSKYNASRQDDGSSNRFSTPELEETPKVEPPKAADPSKPVPAAPQLEVDPPESVEPLQPIPEGAEIKDPAACTKIYNDRNCCTESDNCKELINELHAFDITRISLDITPRYAPDAESKEIEDRRKTDALSVLDSRPWTDIYGTVLAEGQMIDFKNGEVVVKTDSGLERLKIRNLGSDDQCFVAAWWKMPYECGWNKDEFEDRDWEPLEVNWTASALCHKPLYFEERALERYGHTTGPLTQPFVSGAHFFGNVITLPYKMGMNPPTECLYALGYYRPGNCAPQLIAPIPLSARGALTQTAAVLGAVYWIP